MLVTPAYCTIIYTWFIDDRLDAISFLDIAGCLVGFRKMKLIDYEVFQPGGTIRREQRSRDPLVT